MIAPLFKDAVNFAASTTSKTQNRNKVILSIIVTGTNVQKIVKSIAKNEELNNFQCPYWQQRRYVCELRMVKCVARDTIEVVSTPKAYIHIYYIYISLLGYSQVDSCNISTTFVLSCDDCCEKLLSHKN